ncbi:hypothetical protein BLNAU_10677 [Blattamonas nauphoetae]|uniref:Right handed beta helix domain-containing protein n=1 Tax=Blattamonas nauphoetae TaxID=2049346 RepID=A0ABQ9XS86_9EUKA|nr:hypothetical protein BLNAU_10677 [Blattamonas nauphoetae]
MSGGCCSPIVVGSQSGCDGSSISFLSCCHEPSTQNQLFPLVDFDSRTNPPFHTSMNADDDITTQSADGTVHRNISFTLSPSERDEFASPALRQIGSIGQSQKMIGVEVSGCSNHLYGTVCDDMNNGGSILCSNSSFSRCSTSLPPSSTHPAYAFQHRTGSEQKILLPPTDSSYVLFSHCTFHSMTSRLNGGAINLKNGCSPVSIAACSFVDCSSSSWNGGAVFVDFSSSSRHRCQAKSDGGSVSIGGSLTASLADCSFVGTELKHSNGGCLDFSYPKGETQICNCRFSDASATYGGAIRLNQPFASVISFSSFISCDGSSIYITQVTETVDILNCMFVECNGSFGGAGIYLERCAGLATVKDSLFDRCNASDGGGLHISRTPTFSLHNLKFRACTGVHGKDIYLRLSKTEVIQGNMITNCVSTSDTNNILFFFNGSYEFDNTLIHPVDSIDVPSIALSASLDGDDAGWSLSVTASESVDGRMLDVLDHNSASVYEKPNLDSPPPIARLFVFDFSSSQTASQPVSINEWNLLQYEANYSMTMASLAGTDITLSSSNIETPNPARIVEVITDWSSSQPEQLSFQLKGRTLPSGNYIVKVKNVPDLSIDVLFTGQPTNQSQSRNMHSSTATLLLVGEGSKLAFDTKYELESVEKVDGTSLILDPPRLFFTTPNPTRLTSVSDAIFADPLDKSTVSITLSGGNIPTGSYSLNVSLIGEDPSTEISLHVSFSSSDSGTTSAVVFKRDGSQTDLVFDKNYTIHSLSNDQHNIWIPSPLSFSVPPSPGIVSTVLSASLNDTKTVVTLTLCGTHFASGPTHVVLLEGSNVVRSNGDLNVINTTHFTVSFPAGWAQTSSTVAYNQSYSVKSVASLSDSFLVRSSILVNIPKPPCVTGISCNFDTNFTHFVVTLSGESLPSSETYTARLMAPSASFEVTFSDDVGRSDPIEGNATNGLLFGTTYKLSSLSHGMDLILLNKTDFSTPTPSFVNVASFDFVNEIKTSCKLVLGGTDLTLGGEFKVTLEPPLSIIVSFSSATHGESDELRIGWPDTLQYGQNYTLKSITHSVDDTPACLVDSI